MDTWLQGNHLSAENRIFTPSKLFGIFGKACYSFHVILMPLPAEGLIRVRPQAGFILPGTGIM